MVAVTRTLLNFSSWNFVYIPYCYGFGYHNLFGSLPASLRNFRSFSFGKDNILIYGLKFCLHHVRAPPRSTPGGSGI